MEKVKQEQSEQVTVSHFGPKQELRVWTRKGNTISNAPVRVAVGSFGKAVR